MGQISAEAVAGIISNRIGKAKRRLADADMEAAMAKAVLNELEAIERNLSNVPVTPLSGGEEAK